MSARDFDFVLFGASGFVGKLTAEYLAAHKPGRWAIAGRNEDKLAALGFDVPILVVDAMDAAGCDAIARRTRVICTTVGPYSKYGHALVAACADAGTHYCDLTGEPNFVLSTTRTLHERAARTGARIVHSCGFDSIPSDLGTWAVQEEFHARYGHYADKVTAFYGEMRGEFSGGTYASGFAIAEAMKDPEIRRALRNPYALDPDPDAPHPRVEGRPVGWDPDLKMFYVPFLMAAFNALIVRRGHALAGHPWGSQFVYREVMSTPGNARGAVMAATITAGLAGLAQILKRPALRALVQKRVKQPGEGPSSETRTRGHWKVRYVAVGGSNGRTEKLVYTASDPHGDPGYASTAKMLGEATLCLAYDTLSSPGGVLTPSVAMDGALLDRLRRAGIAFQPA